MGKKSAQTARFVLLPVRGLHSEEMRNIGADRTVFAAAASLRLEARPARLASRQPTMRVIHSIGETGPKLVEMGEEEIAAMRVSDPGVRAVPVVIYELARRPVFSVESKVQAAAAALAPKLSVRCIDRKTQMPLQGVNFVAFTNFKQRIGDGGLSDSNGKVVLELGAASVKLEVLVAYGPPGYWGLGKKATTLKNGMTFKFEPVDLATPDFAATLYAGVSPDAGESVVVGVIDSGVDGTHPDLHVTGGGAFVTAENDAGGSGPAAKHGDHGTHVAGIIASTGLLHPQPPKTAPGKRGIAPKVTLYSYRVFPNSGTGAANYDIIRAIEQGVHDKCDFLNLSLGASSPDQAVEAAIKDAFDNGTVCIVATGNDDRSPVSYPAAWDVSVAVTSAGKKGTYPATSNEMLDEVGPYATTDASIFISAFSNVGPPVDLTGPGEGIVSTLPGGLYGVMSGTSMACPSVTGVAASLLSANPTLLGMARNRDRSIAMVGMLNSAATPLGFNPQLEGVGLLR